MDWICVKTRLPDKEDEGDTFLCNVVTPTAGGHYTVEAKTLKFNRKTNNWVCGSRLIVTHWMSAPATIDLCDCEAVEPEEPTEPPKDEGTKAE